MQGAYPPPRTCLSPSPVLHTQKKKKKVNSLKCIFFFFCNRSTHNTCLGLLLFLCQLSYGSAGSSLSSDSVDPRADGLVGPDQRAGGSRPGAPLSRGKCHHCRTQFPRYYIMIIIGRRCFSQNAGLFARRGRGREKLKSFAIGILIIWGSLQPKCESSSQL